MMHSDFSLSIRPLGGFHAAYTGMYHRVACGQRRYYTMRSKHEEAFDSFYNV